MVISLYKNKGKRDQINNYRGIFLLSMASRILARVMASRIRDWSEEIYLLDVNQQGFRAGRSTADATQILVRMHEELINENNQSENSIKAILLDIQKAYPRVNKPILCQSGRILTLPIRKGPNFANPEGSYSCLSGRVLFLSNWRGAIFANPEGS